MFYLVFIFKKLKFIISIDSMFLKHISILDHDSRCRNTHQIYSMFTVFCYFLLTACPLNTSVSWTMTPDVGIPCQISSLCTGIECCVHANNLLRDFQTRVVVDPCQFVVSIGIDNYIRNISLSRFEYGKYLLSYSYYILTNTAKIELRFQGLNVNWNEVPCKTIHCEFLVKK